MTHIELALIGIIISILSGTVGYKIGVRTFNEICKERQASCLLHVMTELENIKTAQTEMKDALKELNKKIIKQFN